MTKKLSIGNQLYFYQLFCRKIGIGKQCLISQFEEALSQDNIVIDDLEIECTSTLDLLKQMPTCIKLTVFKGGRIYATVIRVPVWDNALNKSENVKKSAGKTKSFKHKKTNTLKPVRPRMCRNKKVYEKPLEQTLKQFEVSSDRKIISDDKQASYIDMHSSNSQSDTQTTNLNLIESENANSNYRITLNPQKVSSIPTSTYKTNETAHTKASTNALSAVTFSKDTKTDSTKESENSYERKTESALIHQTSNLQQTHNKQPHDADDLPRILQTPHPHLTVLYDPAAPDQNVADSISHSVPQNAYGTNVEENTNPTAQNNVKTENFDSYVPPHAQNKTSRITHWNQFEKDNPTLPSSYPSDFTREVYCNDNLLNLLSTLIPVGANLATILNEDWRYARSTGSIIGTQNKATFPLRYFHDDGIKPITITIRRVMQSHEDKHWSVVLVDGRNAANCIHEPICFAGLPRTHVCACEELSPCSCFEMPFDPEHEFTNNCIIGSWNSFLTRLAQLSIPEPWTFPRGTINLNILREYICMTYICARNQNKLAISKNFMTFNTGLMTPALNAVYACFTAHNKDIPWKFEGFSTASFGPYAHLLIENFNELPPAPVYITSLDQVLLNQHAKLQIDIKAILVHSFIRMPKNMLLELLKTDKRAQIQVHELFDVKHTYPECMEIAANLAHVILQTPKLLHIFTQELEPSITHAFEYAKLSYHSIAPAFDPSANTVKLLVPISFVDVNTTDAALVLSHIGENSYKVSSIMSLPNAYVCARLISRELPSWLTQVFK